MACLRGLGRCERGTSAVEQVLVLALVALAALALWAAFGDAVALRAQCAATSIEGGAAPCGGLDAAVAATGGTGATHASRSSTASRSAALTSGAPGRGAEALAGGGRGQSVETRGIAAAAQARPSNFARTPAALADVARTPTALRGGPMFALGAGRDVTAARGQNVALGEDAHEASHGGGLAGVWGFVSDHSNIDELVDAVSKTAAFAAGVGQGLAYGAWDVTTGLAGMLWKIVSDPIETVESIAGAIAHPRRLLDIGEAIVVGTWQTLREEGLTLIHGSPRERGEVVGRIGFDLFLTLGTAGVAVVSKTGRLAKTLHMTTEHLDDVAGATRTTSATLRLDALGAARGLITTGGTATAAQAKWVERQLAQMPRPFLDALGERGTSIVVANGNVLDALPELARTLPPGVPVGYGWSNIAALYLPERNTIVFSMPKGRSRAGIRRGRALIHEVGHALDGRRSTSKAFLRARESSELDHWSFTQRGVRGVKETFAESFALYATDPLQLERKWPALYDYWASDPLHVFSRERPGHFSRFGRGVVRGDFDPVSAHNALGQLVTSFTPGYAQIGDVRDLMATLADMKRREPTARVRTVINGLAVSSGMSSAQIGAEDSP